MKITIEHFPMRLRFGEENALKMIKDAGFDGVDYSFNQMGNGQAIDLTDHIKKANAVKKLLADLGLICTQAHAPFGLKYGVKFSMDDKQFSDTVKSIEYASVLGVKQIVVHSVAVPEDADFFACNFDFYKSLESYAKDCGIEIAVENLVNSKLRTPSVLSDFVRKLNSPVFSACADLGHAMITGTPPEDFIAGMDKGMLKCVHVQDTDGSLDKHWIPYQGVQNWDAVMRALAGYGYDGTLDMEVIHSFDFLPDELMLPALRYTATVGKSLAEKFEGYKKVN